METPPGEENFNDVETVGMEDSLFPYISDNYNQFITTGHGSMSAYKKQLSPMLSDQQSDLEADSMPESQMELTEADVYTQLEHKERDLILAAELGKSLLEKNEELSHENERLSLEFHERLDALEQEKHELRRKLECKTNECELNSHQLHADIKRLQDDLDERQGMLVAVEREKSRAIEELSEQNHKLLGQLQRSSDAESQLSKQVQQLRKEFLERTNSTSVRILQLESQKQESEQDSQIRAQLESNFDAMKDESALLRDELVLANERAHHLERHLHEKERELKRMSVELNDAHLSNRQLQVRIDELREEMSLQMSFTSNGNSSLLAELEQTGVDCSQVITPITSPSRDESDEEKELQDHNTLEFQNTMFDCALPAELSLRCYQALLTAVSNCHQHLFELKQEMWETYQRIISLSTILRTYVNKSSDGEGQEGATEPPHSPHMINISGALTDLSKLVHEAFHAKEVRGGPDGSLTKMLKEKHAKLMQERDEAVAAKNELEVNLASTKVDMMSVNSQLLEAIQQKLHQQKELEAWQDDMELMIQKALNDRNEMKKVNSLRHQQLANQDQSTPKSSWFSFSRRRPPATSDSPVTSSSHASSPALQSPDSEQKSGRFAFWLKRKAQPANDQPITDDDPTT